MKLILILILAVTATAQQTKWERLFELEEKGIVFYIANIKLDKEGASGTFDGKMTLDKKTIIHYFKADCTKKEMFLLGGEIEEKKLIFDEEVKVQIVEKSAIEAAYFRVCGKDG